MSLGIIFRHLVIQNVEMVSKKVMKCVIAAFQMYAYHSAHLSIFMSIFISFTRCVMTLAVILTHANWLMVQSVPAMVLAALIVR